MFCPRGYSLACLVLLKGQPGKRRPSLRLYPKSLIQTLFCQTMPDSLHRQVAAEERKISPGMNFENLNQRRQITM